jgi:DNA-directed RNA polymerase specialized sigma subunit
MSTQSDNELDIELEKLGVDRQTDIDRLMDWQKTRDPNRLTELVVRYQPIVNKVVNKYRTTGVSVPTLKTKANAQLLKALVTYDPSRNTSPTTHIWNNLQQVQRLATESLTSGHIPEYRNLKRSIFVTTKQNLTDRLGYEPNISQLSDEMNWSQAEVQRMNEELSGEVTASNAEFDFYGNARQFVHKDKELATYLYHELGHKDKVIFEHTFGYGGKSILKNKELAEKLHTNEMAIHRAKNRLADKIREYQ